MLKWWFVEFQIYLPDRSASISFNITVLSAWWSLMAWQLFSTNTSAITILRLVSISLDMGLAPVWYQAISCSMQCYLLVNWTIRNTFQRNFIQKPIFPLKKISSAHVSFSFVVQTSICSWSPEPDFNKMMPLWPYRNFHYKDKIVLWLSYLYNGNPYNWIYDLYIEMGAWHRFGDCFKIKIPPPLV